MTNLSKQNLTSFIIFQAEKVERWCTHCKETPALAFYRKNTNMFQQKRSTVSFEKSVPCQKRKLSFKPSHMKNVFYAT